MFNLRDLVGRKRPDHAMYDVEAAQKLLDDLPGDHGKALAEIASWLETVGRTEGFDPDVRIGVIKLLDETGQKRASLVLSVFLGDAVLKEFDRLQLWQALAGFWEQLASGYRVCLKEIESGRKPGDEPHPERALIVLRALRALAQEAKILHLRYLPVAPRVWQDLSELYARSEDGHFAAKPIKVYANDPLPTTARQEFLRELMLDASLPESELPREIELASRVIARLGGGFLLHTAPGEGCNLCFDLMHPGRPIHHTPETPAGTSMRYFGPGLMEAAIREVLERHTAHPEVPEKLLGDDFSTSDKLLVLKHLLLYWGKTPPHRRTQRVKIIAQVKVAHGITAASHLVTRVEFSGMAEVTSNLNLKMKQQTGFTLEEQSAATALSEWTERDASTWGLGVDIPRQDEPWAKIGTLCAIQPAGLKSWWLGVIRRFYRDPQNHAHAGIEFIGKKPLAIYLRGIGQSEQRADNWASSSGSFQFTYVQALLLGESTTASSKEMLVPRDSFTPGMLFEAMIGEETPHVRLDELLERGEDYDRVQVTWLKGAA